MGTLHCALENGADLYVNERQEIRHYRAALGLLKKEERRGRRNECRIAIFNFARSYLPTIPDFPELSRKFKLYPGLSDSCSKIPDFQAVYGYN